jgi:hypothetical protein
MSHRSYRVIVIAGAALLLTVGGYILRSRQIAESTRSESAGPLTERTTRAVAAAPARDEVKSRSGTSGVPRFNPTPQAGSRSQDRPRVSAVRSVPLASSDEEMYQVLKLTPPQIESVEAVLEDTHRRLLELSREANQGKLSKKEFRQAMDRLDIEADEKMLEVMGPDNLEKYNEYSLQVAAAFVDTGAFGSPPKQDATR